MLLDCQNLDKPITATDASLGEGQLKVSTAWLFLATNVFLQSDICRYTLER
jgi:hypothetical protein